MEFLPYQKAWLRDTARIKILEKSRQIGMSWCTAYGLVRRALSSEALDIWVSTRDELQAKLFIADCCHFADAYDQAFKKVTKQSLLAQRTALSLTFFNGRSICGLSSSIDAQAGKRGTRVLDEFALHYDPAALYAIAYPGITWGGSLEILSTHRGADNPFNRLVQEAKGENKKSVSLHRVTLADALDQGLLKKIKKKLSPDDPRYEMDEAAYFDYVRRSCIDEATFLQEYMCVPEDEATLFLPHATLSGCTYDASDGSWDNGVPAQTGDCVIGVDLARHHDLTVFWVLEKVGDVWMTRVVKSLRAQPFSVQEGVLVDLARSLPNLRRVCIDQTGLGAQFYERVSEKLGRNRVEGVTLTNASKDTMACALRLLFEEKKIRIPDDRDVLADLRKVRRVYTSCGNTRLAASHGDSHADFFWALALAVHAGNVHSRPSAATYIHVPRHTHIRTL